MEKHTYAEELIARMPEGMTMPDMLVKTFNWLEQNGHRRTHWDGELLPFERQDLSLYPIDQEPTNGDSLVGFGYNGPFATNEDSLHMNERVFLFVTTGGDGSQAGFWLDDDGKQWIVHMGSGSGSTWWGRLSDDPADLLRLLAIGYVEPAFDEVHDMTPMEDFLNQSKDKSFLGVARLIAEGRITGANGIDDFISKRDALAKELAEKLEQGINVSDDYVLPNPPLSFQQFLKTEFGIETPERASDFLPYPAKDIDENDDPFAIWIEAVEPTEDELAYLDAMEKTAMGLSLWQRIRGWFSR